MVSIVLEYQMTTSSFQPSTALQLYCIRHIKSIIKLTLRTILKFPILWCKFGKICLLGAIFL